MRYLIYRLGIERKTGLARKRTVIRLLRHLYGSML